MIQQQNIKKMKKEQQQRKQAPAGIVMHHRLLYFSYDFTYWEQKVESELSILYKANQSLTRACAVRFIAFLFTPIELHTYSSAVGFPFLGLYFNKLLDLVFIFKRTTNIISEG